MIVITITLAKTNSLTYGDLTLFVSIVNFDEIFCIVFVSFLLTSMFLDAKAQSVRPQVLIKFLTGFHYKDGFGQIFFHVSF